MILNRAAIDRGLARGYVYKTEVLDLKEEKGPVRFAVPRPKPQKGAPVSADKPSTIFGQKLPQNLATQVRLLLWTGAPALLTEAALGQQR